MPSRTTGRVDVTKITQASNRLQRSRGFAQTENGRNKYFYFCRIALAEATASSQARAAMYSTRGRVIGAQRKRIVRPSPCRRNRNHGRGKKIGAGVGARNQSARGINRRAESIGALNRGLNILKSRRRVWNLRRGRPHAIALPVSVASRNDRLQAVPQLTPPERLGQAVLDTEILDLVLPKDESRLNDDGRRDAERAQLV